MVTKELSRAFETQASLDRGRPSQSEQSPRRETSTGFAISDQYGGVMCSHCRGMGHIGRVCPSVVRYRSFQQVMDALARAKNQSQTPPRDAGGRPPQTTTKPGRGGGRGQPRRFQARGKGMRIGAAEEAHRVEATCKANNVKNNMSCRDISTLR